jgi:hypothetical protein
MRILLLYVEIIKYYMCLVLNHCLEDRRGACDVCNKCSSNDHRLFLHGAINTLQDAVWQLWDDGLSTQQEGKSDVRGWVSHSRSDNR